MTWDDDQYILDQFKRPKSRDKAFTALVTKYQRPLYAHIFRMLNEHESTNDVLQNVFIKVWRHLDQFREDAKLSTWLFRIAVNESLTWIEKNEKHHATSLPEEESSASFANAPSAAEIEKKLEQAIKTLPAKQRTVFIMRYFDEKPYEEMSAILDTSVGALKASYHHAVKKIEEFLLGD